MCKAVNVVLVYIFWMIYGKYFSIYLLAIYMSFVKYQFKSLSESSLCLPLSYFLFFFSFLFSLLMCRVLCRSLLHMGPFPITCVVNILRNKMWLAFKCCCSVFWWTESLISLNSNVAIFSYLGFFFFFFFKIVFGSCLRGFSWKRK